MLKLIFFSIIIIALAIWLSVIPNGIVINYDHYQISTTLTKLLIIIFVTFIPIYIIFHYVNAIYRKIINKFYISSTLSMLHSLPLNENKDVIYNIVMHKPTSNFITSLKRINKNILQEHYENAIQSINKAKKTKSNLLIFNRYLVQIYLKTKNHTALVNVCKQSLSINPKDYWFYKQLLNVTIQNKLSSELQYLIQHLNKLSIDGKAYNNTYAVLYYALSQDLPTKAKDKAINYCKKIISINPKFLPAYEFLLKHHSHKGEHKLVNEYLSALWVKIPSIEAIELWKKYYNDTKIDFIQKIVQSSKSATVANNNLLLATMYIKFGEYLQAEDILNRMDESKEKNLTYLSLINKTARNSRINEAVTKLTKQYSNNDWWLKYL